MPWTLENSMEDLIALPHLLLKIDHFVLSHLSLWGLSRSTTRAVRTAKARIRGTTAITQRVSANPVWTPMVIMVRVEMAIFEYVKGLYNPYRRHSMIEYQSPINYEKRYNRKNQGLKQ